MNTEFWIALIGSATTLGGSVISWLLAKRKYYSEVDHNIIENMKESLEFYKKLSDDNKLRLDEMAERNKALEEEVKDLRKQVVALSTNVVSTLSKQLKTSSKTKKNEKSDSASNV